MTRKTQDMNRDIFIKCYFFRLVERKHPKYTFLEHLFASVDFNYTLYL